MASPLTSAEKRALKVRAAKLDPVVKVGHAGVSDAFLQSLDAALTVHELVKVRFTDHKEEKKTLGPQIADRTGSELVQRVGNVAVYFRRKASSSPPE